MSERDEAARRKAEQERIEAEGERVQNEEVRQEQEGAGIGPEVSRVDAESDRDEAEAIRERQSLSRREAEKGRVENETIRIEAEQVRIVAETKRGSIRGTYLRLAAVMAMPLAFVALIPSVIGLLYLNSIAKENRERSIEVRDSLCSFKRDLGRRHDQTAEFVAQIESGVRRPIAGISVADLERSRDNLQITLKSLSGLDCG